MAGQERGGEVLNEFFQLCLTIKLKNTVSFSLIIAEIKQLFHAVISGVGTLCMSDLENLKF